MISARRAVARASPVAWATSVRVSVARPSPNEVITVSPRASDSMNSRPSSCLDAPVQAARPEERPTGPEGPEAPTRAEAAATVGSRSSRSIAPTAARSRGSSTERRDSAVS